MPNKDDSVQVGLSSINQEFKEREVAERARSLGVRYINLEKIPINPDTLHLIPREISLRAAIVPFHQLGRQVKVAALSLKDTKTKEVIALLEHKYKIESYLCSEESLHFAQQNYEEETYHEKEEVSAHVDEEKKRNLNEELEQAKKLPEQIKNEKSDVALNALHELAIALHISDFHFHPNKTGSLLRGRIDGVLFDLCEFDPATAEMLIRQIKHDSDLKFNITRLPQDGKYSFVANEREVDVRVSTFPANFGESIVLRFLDSKKGIAPLEQIGFLENAEKRFLEGIHATSGMILVTGPTGSGKTTTLYSAISTLNTRETKIATLEDPIEFRLEGIVQSQVDEKHGFDFGAGLRSMLRQDPDIVLIGEIRDKETAETAVQSALTGHLVFSTLHTNSAADAIPRLVNMGIKPYVLAPALRMVIAQRLLRMLCPHCREERSIQEHEKTLLAESLTPEEIPETLFTPKGCPTCANTGYLGQTAAIEVLVIDDELKQDIFGDIAAHKIAETARARGMRSMWQEGMKKVALGQTSIDEVRRKIGE